MKTILYTDYVKVGDHRIKMVYSQSDEEAARMREKTINDWNNGMISAKLEGRAEGRAEGITVGEAKKEAEILERMQLLGLSADMIQSILNHPQR